MLFQARDLRLSVGYSILSEAELWVGITPHPLRNEPVHITLLKPFRRYFVNVSIARRAGTLRRLIKKQGYEQTLADCIIASTAEFNNLIVCTRNARHFELFKQYGISVLTYSA